jgi:integrase
MSTIIRSFLVDDLAGSRAIVEEFIAQADVGEASRTKYQTHLAAFARWLHDAGYSPSGCALLEARAPEAHRFMASLNLASRPGGPLSASTRKNYLSSLRSFYGYCRQVRLVPTDPSAEVRAPRIQRAPGFHLTSDELRRLLDINTGPRDRIQTYLLVYTAARSGELRRLRWQDIDFAGRTMLVCGKGGRPRTIDIHPVLCSELRKWFVHQEIAAEKSAEIRSARSNPETDHVLMTCHGKQLQASTLHRQLKRRATLAGLYTLERKGREPRSKVTPHSLRRSFATILLNDGQPLDAVADVLGHQSLNTTRNHYAFSTNHRRRETIEAFNV